MEPLVSVVVPFYNQREFVEETLASVVGQDYPRIELIASDDGSSDGTLEEIERFADAPLERVKILSAPSNLGISGNMNKALAEVTGELVAWLGGDDVMLPGRLRHQVNSLKRSPGAVASVHDAEVFDSASGKALGRFTELYNRGGPVRSGGIELVFDPTYYMLPSATMFRTSAMPSSGFDERLRFANDLLWHIELLRNGNVVGSQEVLVRYRRHGGNITADPQTTAQILEEALIAMAIVSARYPELERLARRRATALLLSEARRLAASGDRRRAARYARSAFVHGGPIGASAQAVRLASALRRRPR